MGISADMCRCWSPTALRRPRALLAASAVFVTTAAIAALISCNVHEIGHAGVGIALGWDVERVNWCLPTGGSVDYAHVGTWAANAQGYAGGLSGAAVLALAYVIGVSPCSKVPPALSALDLALSGTCRTRSHPMAPLSASCAGKARRRRRPCQRGRLTLAVCRWWSHAAS